MQNIPRAILPNTSIPHGTVKNIFSHIRRLGAAGALAVDICICFHDIES